MTRTVFVNQKFLPIEQAAIPVMDRGFLFGDSVYEVSAVFDGRLVDNSAHLARLARSLGEIGIANPYDMDTWKLLQRQLIERNGLRQGIVYIQVTRGVADRDFPFPDGVAPGVVMFTQEKNMLDSAAGRDGVRVATVPDLRWSRRDIKSTGLLAQVLAKQAAVSQSCAEAWMVEDGYVTEGSSSTAFIITRDDAVVTRPLSNSILPGVTRMAVLRLAEENGLSLEERLFSVEEAYEAKEAFYTSASSLVTPVIMIDDKPIGGGAPGPNTARLRTLYLDFAHRTAE